MSHNWLHTPDCKVLNEVKNATSHVARPAVLWTLLTGFRLQLQVELIKLEQQDGMQAEFAAPP